MKCSWCPETAHFDFGEGQRLCTDCTNLLLDRSKIMPEAVPTETDPPSHPLDIPDYLRRVS